MVFYVEHMILLLNSKLCIINCKSLAPPKARSQRNLSSPARYHMRSQIWRRALKLARATTAQSRNPGACKLAISKQRNSALKALPLQGWGYVGHVGLQNLAVPLTRQLQFSKRLITKSRNAASRSPQKHIDLPSFWQSFNSLCLGAFALTWTCTTKIAFKPAFY